MEPWQHVVQIPEQEVGHYKISHIYKDPGEIPRSNMRTAIMGGQAEEPLVFGQRTQWHQLSYDGGVWMTDLPIEQQQHDNELEGVEGTVLVGGLGIGYAATVLAKRPWVEKVRVVEISPEVIQMVAPHLKDPDNKIEIIEADLLKYLQDNRNNETFDYAFYDIWQSDGMGTFLKTVCPLRESTLENQWVEADSDIICWNENVMRGQLVRDLFGRQNILKAQILPNMPKVTLDMLCDQFRGEPDIYWDWAIPFWKAVRAGNVTEESFEDAARTYAGMYGTRELEFYWLARYGESAGTAS